MNSNSSKPFLLFYLASVLTVVASVACAMEISSDAPSGVFITGNPVVLKVQGATESIVYELTDYFGVSVTKGSAQPAEAEAGISLGVLQPGWYEFRCRCPGTEQTFAVAVVRDRKGAPPLAEGRVCFDGIGSAAGYAQALNKAGIPWVRDRMWWNAVQPGNGPIDWKWYPESVQALGKAGIRVCQVWHDCPPWLHPEHPDLQAPDDIREYYKFAREMARTFSDAYFAFEPSNEPDAPGWGGNWSCRANRLAAYTKAASLGIKSVRPDALVLNGSMSWGVTPFMNILYESGIGEYTDVFNWHFYGGADRYALSLDAYRRVMAKYGAEKRPAWLTEGGSPMSPSSGPDGADLRLADQKTQCRDAVYKNVLAMAAGNDKYFYFCLQHYMERGLQFGVTYKNNTVYPAFVSLSAMANFVGISEYLGVYKDAPKGVSAHVFSTATGNVLLAWTGEPANLRLKTDKPDLRMANLFGAEKTIPASNGEVNIEVGVDPVYVLDVPQNVMANLVRSERPRFDYPKNNPSKVVLMGYCNLPIHGDRCCYLIGRKEQIQPFDFTVEVVNFNENQKVEGNVWLEAPAGWTVDDNRQTVSLEAMDKKSLTFRVHPVVAQTRNDLTTKLVARGRFGQETLSPSVSYIGSDPADLTPVATEPMPWGEAARWQEDKGGQVTLVATQAGEGIVRFESKDKPDNNNDAFSYWRIPLNPPMDLRKFDGLSFDVKTETTDMIRLMLVEASGAPYFATIIAPRGEKRRTTITFRDMLWGLWFTDDPNATLDLDQIVAVKIGKEGGNFVFEAGNFQLIRLQP